jgi:pimeloyl-ACP methyl ester carboxylesterase
MAAPTPTDPFERPRTVRSSDDVALAVYDLGGDGPDLLFVHATGFCAGVWGPLAERLDGFRRVAVDVRGHGRSTVPTGDLAWRGAADDVLATVDACGLDRPFGVGHSMGGAALLLAEQARPGTFDGLWIYEPVVFPPGTFPADGPNPMSEAARRRRPDFDSAAAAVANFSAKAPLDELDPDCLDAYVRHGFEERPDGSVTLRCRPEVEAATYRMAPDHDALEHLGEVGCPVTVLVGRDDPFGPGRFAADIAGRLPHGRLEEHPELGHFGPLEGLDAMAASIRSAVTPAA